MSDLPDYSLDDYIDAPSGIGPLAYEWSDKPHRLVYDLVVRIAALEAENAKLRRAQGPSVYDPWTRRNRWTRRQR